MHHASRIMVFISSALSITKRFNKALAPNLLSWSLRLHESLHFSPTIPFFTSSAVSVSAALLPLAQRLVSLEVQDDYRRLNHRGEEGGGDGSSISSAWNNFVDNSWNVLFEDRHRRLATTKERRDDEVEREAQRLYEARRRRKRNGRRWDEPHAKLKRVGGQDTHDTQRVRLLEKYVRPALLPTSSAQDLDRHAFTHHRESIRDDDARPTDGYDNFVKWLRGEYLIARHGRAVQRAMRKYPELRDDAAGLSTLESESDDGSNGSSLKLLPSVKVVREAFGMRGWSRRKVPLLLWEDAEMEGANGSPPLASDIPASKSTEDGVRGDRPSSFDVDGVTIEHIIHRKLRGNIVHSGSLNAFFEMRRREDSYELWTRDYISGLARYLLDRIDDMDHSSPKETIVLDVGAGDGRLAYFLRQGMEEFRRKSSSANIPSIVATDDGSWRAPLYDNRHILVEKLSAVESLDKYGPRLDEDGNAKTRLIVLCSWMPPGQDWTAAFRRPIHNTDAKERTEEGERSNMKRLVEEYILIGEADDGTCGHHWHTWGNPNVLEEYDGVRAPPVAPYARDGYTRADLDWLSEIQFSRFDCRLSGESSTVSFRRDGDIIHRGDVRRGGRKAEQDDLNATSAR